MSNKTDFSQGPVWQNIVRQAVPLIIAQLVLLTYHIVDRIYIGHMPVADNMALTGIGVTTPIVTIIAAFAYMFHTGGTPIFSMARGADDIERAKKILGNVAFLILVTAITLTVVCFIFRRPILFAFGASEESYYYANQYIRIYLIGTIFSMITTGLNGFINSQGFPRVGMVTTIIGAILNLILDPIFIFVFNMGLQGAAIATVISQFFSAAWVILFLTGKKTLIKIEAAYMKPDFSIIQRVVSLGMSGFIVQATNAAVQIACNSTLQAYGGDLYVGIMTVIYSVREVLSLPIGGISGGSQPVISFNYGAKKYDRVKQGIRVAACLGIGYTMLAWALVLAFPHFLISIFTTDLQMISTGTTCLKAYFFGFVFMAFQFSGQQTFQALGKAKQSIFFSLLRKVIIVVPLTLLLPRLGMGVMGVFWAEPISNLIGGMASFLTMYFTVYRKL